jgi:serine/threonine-protein kinase
MPFATLPPGTRLGRFQIVELLGQGGMGVVYKAVDTGLGRTVALKVLPRELLSGSLGAARFDREARAAAAVVHPNVIGVHYVGVEAGLPCMALEFAPGGTLGARLKRGALPWKEAVALAAKLARGLAAVHAAGLVHRDLKPENVLLDARGEPRLADFGLVAGARRGPGGLTRTGELLGTLEYMAPEQADEARTADHRADLYSLGALVYALVAGRPPFDGQGYGLMKKIFTEQPVAPGRHVPGIPAALDALVLGLLAKNPDDRPRTADEVASALEVLARDDVPRPPRSKAGLLVVAVIGALAIAGFFAARALSPTAKDAPPIPVPPPILVPPPVAPPPVSRPPAVEPGVQVRLFRLPDGSDMELVLVPAGDFVMGADDAGALRFERPRHTHPMAHPFWIGRNDVTWAQYLAFTRATGREEPAKPSWWSKLPGTKSDHPVVFVSWEDAKAYCAWAKLELPSEPEWEKAARGHDGRTYPWGDDWDPGSRCNYADRSCPMDDFTINGKKASEWIKTIGGWDRDHSDGHAFTSPVGSFPRGASPSGALDMEGNVYQWCEDCFEDSYRRYATGDFAPPSGSLDRVRRGGSWNLPERLCRASVRGRFGPGTRADTLGFRVVLRSQP